jgi:hypothetical protein
LKKERIFPMLKFQGSLDDLQNTVMQCAILGEWSFHRKSRFYRFQAATGAILNWWPSTGTINFQGHDAEQFERLFLDQALAAAQSEPGSVCEEPVWEAVASPTLSLDGSREAPSFAGPRNRRRLASPTSSRLIPRSVKLLGGPDRG